MNAQDAKAAGGAQTPAEKFNNIPNGSAPAFPNFPTDDGRRYDPEALSYGGGNNASGGYAR